MAATWQSGAVQLWMWYGSAYAQALAWAPPVPLATDGAVRAIAFAPQSDGQVGEYTCVPTARRSCPDPGLYRAGMR